MADSGPGRETSEHAMAQKVIHTCMVMAGLVFAFGTTLLETGVLPPESRWVAVVATIVGVCGAMAGKVATSNGYNASRASVKAAGLIGPEKPADPP